MPKIRILSISRMPVRDTDRFGLAAPLHYYQLDQQAIFIQYDDPVDCRTCLYPAMRYSRTGMGRYKPCAKLGKYKS
jgi:hypothetical protein